MTDCCRRFADGAVVARYDGVPMTVHSAVRPVLGDEWRYHCIWFHEARLCRDYFRESDLRPAPRDEGGGG